ncbi:MAG: hypothetical protein A4E49_03151 [Methanosaeta sp. PtaU1.Bin112]|nr:MAG: hypothetical protein A4E49_03151 [Methanosaeta sp. PtaU1.Bin112]
MVTPAIGKKIQKLKAEGLSQHKIAKKLHIAQSTVSDYLKSIGYKSDQSKTKKAVEAKAEYDRTRRRNLNNKFFEKIEQMLEIAKTPADLRALAIPYGVAEDKRAALDPPVPPTPEDDGFMDALDAKASEVWEDVEDIPVSLDAPKPETMANSDLVV